MGRVSFFLNHHYSPSTMTSVLKESTITNKRKSDAGPAATPTKKARPSAADVADAVMTAASHEDMQNRIVDIIIDPDNFVLPANEEGVRDLIVDIAEYASELQGQLKVLERAVHDERAKVANLKAKAVTAAAPAPPQKSPAEIQAAAERLRASVRSGIKKQMSVSV